MSTATTPLGSGKLTASKRIAVVGSGLVALDRIYVTGRESPVEALGGSCANVLTSLSMLGHLTVPVTVLGRDRTGNMLVEEFVRAGCKTEWISQQVDCHSPVIVEILDMERAQHSFVFRCPETATDFPRWHSIDEDHVLSADGILKSASIFYADRLSPAIVFAMETSKSAGALVFFEPSRLSDDPLFARALRTVSILKLSDEVLREGAIDPAGMTLSSHVVVIRTHGAGGLTISHEGTETFFPAQQAPRLADTCGAGDMVTTGIIDALLRRESIGGNWTVNDIHDGVRMGQWLAAMNCAFAGARGIFHALGAPHVRSGIDCEFDADFVDYTLTFDPCYGY